MNSAPRKAARRFRARFHRRRASGSADVGAKVWLSECASASDVSGEGCGAQLAAQTLLATGDDRSGSTTFVVHRTAATEAVQSEPTATCTNDCVIVATQGVGYGDAWAAISFGP